MRKYTNAGLVGVGAVLAAAALLSVGCGASKDPWEGLGGPPRVVVTFPPLACFVQNVGGNDVGVLSLCTTGRGPHDFDPTPPDTQKLQKADLFFLNGLELDDEFANKMAQASGNPRLRDKGAPGVVNLGERLLKLKVPGLVDKFGEHEGHEHGKKEEAHDHGHGEGHRHGEYDPHVWLGIPQAVRMVEIIRDELKSNDPTHAADYDRRAKEYIAKLEKLHAEGKAALKDKKDSKVVTSHDSLHYFAESFDIEVAGVIQLRPGAEPEAATLAKLVKMCKEKGVRVIATEPQYEQKGRSAAETLRDSLRREGVADAEIIELDPLETLSKGDTLDAGWYERRIRANLDELTKALR